MIDRRLSWIACTLLVLSGCMEGAPPSDFHPVPAASPVARNPECPDLRGSYDLAGSPLGAAIADRQPPDPHGLPIRLTFREGVSNTEVWWAVPRDALLRWAHDTRERDPQLYARWRRLVLRGKLDGERGWDRAGFMAAVEKLGPPGPVYAGIAGYRCDANWMRVRDQPAFRGSPDGRAPREKEIWLARDRSGMLLVKDLDIRLKSFSIWGGVTNFLRISARATWSRVPAAGFADAAPLTEADLPSAPAFDQEDRESGFPACADMPAILVGFSGRIRQLLPADVELAYFMPVSADALASSEECRGKVLDVHFSASSSTALEALDEKLRQDPAVRNVTVMADESGRNSDRLRRFRIHLR